METRIVSIDEIYGVYRENNAEELIVDLRPSDQYSIMSIEGSLSIPALKAERIAVDLKAKKRLYLVCNDGKEAPKQAAVFAKLFPHAVIFYANTGGMEEWTNKKYPVIARLADQPKEKNELHHNDPDLRGYMKLTRRLPSELEDAVKARLSPQFHLSWFYDGGRNCFLICDKETKRALVINPLMEIHHHIIDQYVREGCDCDLAVYFDDMRNEVGPDPEVHAQDFATLAGAQFISAKRAADAPAPWNRYLRVPSELSKGGNLSFEAVSFVQMVRTNDEGEITLPVQGVLR